ncbi:hypothetical protein CDD83_9367 [Cordyceps sp. RAO-2017]|nr:hypothetical protein CDD83_9367 [Cordyceps sp. RAO-2017]
MDSLLEETRTSFRTSFLDGLADGRAKPFVIPFSALGSFIVPVVWLAIPHAHRPWLYRTRWIVAAFVVAFNLNVLRWSSSANPGIAYVFGMATAWAAVMNLNHLLWTRPQLEAARALRKGPETVRRREAGDSAVSTGCAPWPPGASSERRIEGKPCARSVEETGSADEAWVWQTFPADAGFLTRLGWAFDLATSIRGGGWNWAISSIPRPRIPARIGPGDAVDLTCMPRRTPSGYEYCLTEGEFLRRRFIKILITYLAVDAVSVCVFRDPYFVVGPDRPYELPPHLRNMPPWLLLAYREMLALVGMISSITLEYNMRDLNSYLVLKLFHPARFALWQYPSAFGSFSHVLDRGLSGWWGAWWHQSFRLSLLAPAKYFSQYLPVERRSRVIDLFTLFASFAMSGSLHAVGSISTMAASKPWKTLLFFLIQAVGIVVQDALAMTIRAVVPKPPRALARATNFLFTLVFMYATAHLFLDDLASAGLCALDKIPVSPLKWLGLGTGKGHWWRWDYLGTPAWYSGKHWWESGIFI